MAARGKKADGNESGRRWAWSAARPAGGREGDERGQSSRAETSRVPRRDRTRRAPSADSEGGGLASPEFAHAAERPAAGAYRRSARRESTWPRLALGAARASGGGGHGRVGGEGKGGRYAGTAIAPRARPAERARRVSRRRSGPNVERGDAPPRRRAARAWRCVGCPFCPGRAGARLRSPRQSGGAGVPLPTAASFALRWPPPTRAPRRSRPVPASPPLPPPLRPPPASPPSHRPSAPAARRGPGSARPLARAPGSVAIASRIALCVRSRGPTHVLLSLSASLPRVAPLRVRPAAARSAAARASAMGFLDRFRGRREEKEEEASPAASAAHIDLDAHTNTNLVTPALNDPTVTKAFQDLSAAPRGRIYNPYEGAHADPGPRWEFPNPSDRDWPPVGAVSASPGACCARDVSGTRRPSAPSARVSPARRRHGAIYFVAEAGSALRRDGHARVAADRPLPAPPADRASRTRRAAERATTAPDGIRSLPLPHARLTPRPRSRPPPRPPQAWPCWTAATASARPLRSLSAPSFSSRRRRPCTLARGAKT